MNRRLLCFIPLPISDNKLNVYSEALNFKPVEFVNSKSR